MSIFSLFFLASTSLAVFALTVNPVTNVVQCQVSLLTWKDGSPPYNLSIYPVDSDDPSDPALVNLGSDVSTSCNWRVNLPVGLVAFLRVRDSVGDSAQSGSFTIQLGSENSCLKSTDTNTPTGASAGATSGDSGSCTIRSVLTSSASASPTSASASSTSTGDSSSPSTSAAASHWNDNPVGTLAMTGVAALVVALVL